MKKEFAKKFVAGSALVGMLVGASITSKADQPKIRGMSFYPSENPVSMKLDVYFPSNGNYKVVCKTDLNSTNEVASNNQNISLKFGGVSKTLYETLGSTNKLFYYVQKK